ncbi:FAD-binding protein [Nonomuraea soli]|uniref:Xylitol oxidase n=1 Tax=Nonomuraea soli TaxID=1032476 RepID=A0A7W0CET3_9ACTN|nr:FAD-binding protein [Nonomuraea soli]MBA2889833.1 xylitol oxidase [Nonomuraea soli]
MRNWAGNVTFRARELHSPSTGPSLQALVARSPRLRVVGTGHTFNELTDTTGDLVSLARMPRTFDLDTDRHQVRIGGELTYADICPRLDAEGWALANLASLPHISVAGAVATGTHGSGEHNGCLSTSVASVELVTAHGDVVTLSRGDEGFDGAVVSLGALGVVTALTLDLVPAFELGQYVFDDALTTDYATPGYSVSVFTDWDGAQLWVKDTAPPRVSRTAADGPRHPIAGMPTGNCTQQLGVPGPWHERLPHFRAEFLPSAGEELQSEFMVAREHADEALAELAKVGERLRPVLHVSEIRSVAADGLWLSPAYGRATVAVHFTWLKEPARVMEAVKLVESVLSPFEPRPHWGKIFVARPGIDPRFLELAGRFDPEGKFRNDLLDELLG